MSKTILIAAGGTGGHIFPGLAAAAELQRSGARVVWLGSKGGMESTLVPQRGLSIHLIDISGLRGAGLRSLLTAPFRLLHALWQTRSVFVKERPDCVLGMGGFAAGPGGITAFLRGTPLVIHEQNAIPGVTNRQLARLARRVLEAFKGSFPGKLNVTAVGNPVRSELAALPAPEQRFVGRQGAVRILVLGGSRGAQALNEHLPVALAKLAPALRPAIKHQAGKGKQNACREAYQQSGVEADVVEFIDDMKTAYEQADLVIARAGALTLAELAAVGIGAILIPYPHAADDHQMANARYFERAGAAEVIAQSALTDDKLAASIERLMRDAPRRLHMAEAARQLALPDAARAVADVCLEVCTG
jgi:UDP-N-acetylglucosamine--N-acetylmuramyl-(pentapeptide) pyrophosphoryl-undecaprenol N-acetylglucosamine transferase